MRPILLAPVRRLVLQGEGEGQARGTARGVVDRLVLVTVSHLQLHQQM